MTNGTGKGPQTQQQAQVELQKFVQTAGGDGLSFTEGAAVFLSKAAAETIVKSGSRRQTPAGVAAAKTSFAHVVEQIGKHAGGSRIDLRAARDLRNQERFCGYRPWC